MDANIKALIAQDEKNTKVKRAEFKELSKKIEFSPEEAQIAFLKELVKDKTEQDAFLKAPKEYAEKHNIALDPEFVQLTVDSVLFDVEITDPIRERLGENGLKDLVDIRGRYVPGSTALGPAAVAAGAACVAAAAAVATLVVTLTRSSRVGNLSSIREVANGKIRLPKGREFNRRDSITKYRKK